MYHNIRCRKCGSILSIKVKDDIIRHSTLAGYKLSNKESKYQHPNCKIEDGEYVFLDLISESTNPLSEASIVVDYTKDENK